MTIEYVFFGEFSLRAAELAKPPVDASAGEQEDYQRAVALYRLHSQQRNPQCGRCSSRVLLVERATGTPYFKHNGQDDKHRGTAHEEACAWYTGGRERTAAELPRWQAANAADSTVLPGGSHGIEYSRRWLQAGLRALAKSVDSTNADFEAQKGRARRGKFRDLMAMPRAQVAASGGLPPLPGLPRTGAPRGMLAAFLGRGHRAGALPGSVMAALERWSPSAEGILQQRRLQTLKETLLNPLLRDELALFFQLCCEMACRAKARDQKIPSRALTLKAKREMELARGLSAPPALALVAATFGSSDDVRAVCDMTRALHRDDRAAYDTLVAPAIKALFVLLETFPFLEAQKERMAETMGSEAADKARFIYLIVRPEAPNVAKVGMTKDLVGLVEQLSGRQGARRVHLVEAALCYDWSRTETAVRKALEHKTGGVISVDPAQPEAREWIEWGARPPLPALAKTFAAVATRVAAEVAVSQRSFTAA
jgi:DNA-directed RNA polymerase subunit RPC12/RpoP